MCSVDAYDFMLQHPILINRPVVVTPSGTRLCRPSEIVLNILSKRQKDHLSKKMAIRLLTKRGSGLSHLSTSKYRTPVYAMWASAYRS
ncbi:predicted protein [Escherichia coli B088]|nr:predicted protein [Escherichia coli B088]